MSEEVELDTACKEFLEEVFCLRGDAIIAAWFFGDLDRVVELMTGAEEEL